ncbi:MAG TPA: hypothetical protein VGF17_23120 [Phytomonospora sp.]
MLALAMLADSAAAQVVSTSVVYIPVTHPGAISTLLVRINDHGQTLGGWVDVAGRFHPFLLDHGVFTDLPEFPGAAETRYFDLNNLGQYVGFYLDPQQLAHSFVFANGAFTPFDFPGQAGTTFAHGLNDQGQIVGAYGPGPGPQTEVDGTHGFLTDVGLQHFTTIDLPGEVWTTPYDINDRGDIVGILSPTGAATRAFLLSGGTLDDFVVPGAGGGPGPFGWVVLGEAYGLNEARAIVGSYGDAVGEMHGFIRNPDGSFVLPPDPNPDAIVTAFNGINDATVVDGRRVGPYVAAYTIEAPSGLIGQTAYLVTAVPEPAILALLAPALLGLVAAGRRRV